MGLHNISMPMFLYTPRVVDWSLFFSTIRKLWGSLETPKMVKFAWNLAHIFFNMNFFMFWKFSSLGPGDEFMNQNEARPLGLPEEPKNDRIWIFEKLQLRIRGKIIFLKLSPVGLARSTICQQIIEFQNLSI